MGSWHVLAPYSHGNSIVMDQLIFTFIVVVLLGFLTWQTHKISNLGNYVWFYASRMPRILYVTVGSSQPGLLNIIPGSRHR